MIENVIKQATNFWVWTIVQLICTCDVTVACMLYIKYWHSGALEQPLMHCTDLFLCCDKLHVFGHKMNRTKIIWAESCLEYVAMLTAREVHIYVDGGDSSKA